MDFSKDLIVGVIGAIVGSILTLFGAFYFYKRQRKADHTQEAFELLHTLRDNFEALHNLRYPGKSEHDHLVVHRQVFCNLRKFRNILNSIIPTYNKCAYLDLQKSLELIEKIEALKTGDDAISNRVGIVTFDILSCVEEVDPKRQVIKNLTNKFWDELEIALRKI